MLKKTRFLSLLVLAAVVFALAVLPHSTPAAARAGEQWLLTGRLATGCNSGESGFSIQFVNLTPGATYFADTIVRGQDGLVYMDEYFSGVAPGPFDNDWYVYDLNYRGLQTGAFPLPAGQLLTITVTLRDASQQVIHSSSAQFTCDQNDFFLQGIAGCDLLPGTENAVGAAFVADAFAYSEPGVMIEPAVVLQAGKTTKVLGMDASGQYYKIVWACDFLWVPVNTLGPNYDEVWNGAPLPTAVVQ